MFGVCVFEYSFLTANTLPASAGAALAGHLYPYVCHAGLQHKQAVTMATVELSVAVSDMQPTEWLAVSVQTRSLYQGLVARRPSFDCATSWHSQCHSSDTILTRTGAQLF